MDTVIITKKKFSLKTCTVFVLSMLKKTLKQYAPPFIRSDHIFKIKDLISKIKDFIIPIADPMSRT